jgi:hypothetical protein
MRQKAEMLADNETPGRPFDPAPDVTVHADEVDVAYLREKQKRSVS